MQCQRLGAEHKSDASNESTYYTDRCHTVTTDDSLVHETKTEWIQATKLDNGNLSATRK